MGQRRAKNERRERPITSGEIRIEGWGSLSRPRDMEACRRVDPTQAPRRVLDQAFTPRRDHDYELPLRPSRPLYAMLDSAQTFASLGKGSRSTQGITSRRCAYNPSRASQSGRAVPVLGTRRMVEMIVASRGVFKSSASEFAARRLRKAVSITLARSELPMGPGETTPRAARSRLLAGTSKWGRCDFRDSRERPPPVYTKVTRR